MKLYNYWRSSSSWRVRIALAYKNLPYEYVPVHLLKDGGEQYRDAHRARNPMVQVPVLELDDGTHLAQSIAILEYLEETYPTPALLPRDAIARAQVRAVAEIVNSGMQPFQNLAVLAAVKDLGGDQSAWVTTWLTRGLVALETIAKQHARKYFFGDELTYADVCLVPQLAGARRFSIDLAAYPTLIRVDAALADHPAFVAAHASRQPDAQEQPK